MATETFLNPLDLLKRIVEENPDASDEELRELWANDPRLRIPENADLRERIMWEVFEDLLKGEGLADEIYKTADQIDKLN